MILGPLVTAATVDAGTVYVFMDAISITVELCWMSKLRHRTAPTLFADIANRLLPVGVFLLGIVLMIQRATGDEVRFQQLPPESLVDLVGQPILVNRLARQVTDRATVRVVGLGQGEWLRFYGQCSRSTNIYHIE